MAQGVQGDQFSGYCGLGQAEHVKVCQPVCSRGGLEGMDRPASGHSLEVGRGTVVCCAKDSSRTSVFLLAESCFISAVFINIHFFLFFKGTYSEKKITGVVVFIVFSFPSLWLLWQSNCEAKHRTSAQEDGQKAMTANKDSVLW